MSQLVQRTSRWLARHSLRRDLPLGRHQGVVTFSFDDAPQSACRLGKQVLEAHACHGTWYVAGGLTDQPEQGKLCHSRDDLRALLRDGHQLGCHTYTHLPCDQLRPAEMSRDLVRNARFLADTGVDVTSLDFSFPLGAFDYPSKRLASRTFRSSRITGGGVQRHVADLNALWSQRLYQRDIDSTRIQTLVDEVAQHKGWLIFYTHDVDSLPSQWGCTPELLSEAIRAALQAGCRVLPVDRAIAYFSG